MWPFDQVLFTEGILPFVLIFVLVFAVLQKTKILGEGKNQIDALIALVVGLVTVGFTYQTGLIINFISWLGIGLVVLLIFFLLYGFVSSGKEGFQIDGWMKWVFLGLISLFVIGVVLVTTGTWDNVVSGLDGNNEWLSGLVLVIVVGVVIAIVLGSSKGNSSG